MQPIKSLEGVAKLALETKCDDFDADSIFRKLTYPVGHRRFAKNSNQDQKGAFGPKWSFATPSKETN